MIQLKSILCLLCWVLTCPSLLALSYQRAAEILAENYDKNGFSQSNHGIYCEFLAEEKIQEIYQEGIILSSVSYGTDSQPIVGELDFIVLDQDFQAIVVIEVKCSKRYYSAYLKAQRQLERFRLRSADCDLDYRPTNDVSLSCDNFQRSDIQFMSLSYEDARDRSSDPSQPSGEFDRNRPFDLSFDLLRQEVIQLLIDFKGIN